MYRLFFFILIFAIAISAFAGGRIIEDLFMPSKTMPKDVKFCVYLPPDYDISQGRCYPVVYLLHGYGDREWGWTQFGEIKEAVDQAIAAREIPPMIIAMPDGKTTYYINDFNGSEPWSDMFIQEFIPYIDKNYRTRADKRYRGIAGLSMGGAGTLQHAMRFPDIFTACAAFSAGVRTDDQVRALPQERLQSRFTKLYGSIADDGALPANWKKFSPMWIIHEKNIDELKKVRYYIDCGDDDFLFEGNCTLSIEMHRLQIPHEFRVRNGHHSWVYWRTGIIDGLKFIAADFIK